MKIVTPPIHEPLEPNTWYETTAEIDLGDQRVPAGGRFCTDAKGMIVRFKQVGDSFTYSDPN